MSGVDTGLFGSNVWTPALAGYNLFLDGDRGTFSDTGGTTPSVNGGVVKRWNDQSGNGHNGSDTSGTANILTTSDLNGHNSIGTTSGAGQMDITYTLNQPYTVFLVMKFTWGASLLFFTDPSGGTAMLQQSITVGDIRLFWGSGVHTTGTGYTDATWQVYCVVINGASTRIRVNANSSVALNPGTNNPTGISIFPNATNQKLAAVLVYPSALSTTDETTERNDINTRFAIF